MITFWDVFLKSIGFQFRKAPDRKKEMWVTGRILAYYGGLVSIDKDFPLKNTSRLLDIMKVSH